MITTTPGNISQLQFAARRKIETRGSHGAPATEAPGGDSFKANSAVVGKKAKPTTDAARRAAWASIHASRPTFARSIGIGVRPAGRRGDAQKRSEAKSGGLLSRLQSMPGLRRAAMAAPLLGMLGGQAATAQDMGASGPPPQNAALVATLGPNMQDPLAGLTPDQIADTACPADPQGLDAIKAVDSPDPSEVLSEKAGTFLTQNTVQILTPDPDGGFDTGSGWRCGNFIITNGHVVGNAGTVFINNVNGVQVSAKVMGVSSPNGEDDIAVLLPDNMAALNVKSIPLARPGEVRVGRNVYVLGYPFGIGSTYSAGKISNNNLPVPGSYSEMIMSDAAANPGNSGGPQVGWFYDKSGNPILKLTGMTTEIFSPTGSFDGINVAKPSRVIGPVKKLVEAGVTPQRVYMGVETSDGPAIKGEINVAIISTQQNIDVDQQWIADIQAAQQAMAAVQKDLQATTVDPNQVAQDLSNIPDDIMFVFQMFGIDPSDPAEQDDVNALLQMGLDYFNSDLQQQQQIMTQLNTANDNFTKNPPDPNKVYILYVLPGSTADKAGVKQFDALVAINGQPVGNDVDEDAILDDAGFLYKMNTPGLGVQITVDRGGSLFTATLPGSLQPGGPASLSNGGSTSGWGWLNNLIPGLGN